MEKEMTEIREACEIPFYQFDEMAAWLAQESRAGWHLTKTGYDSFQFEKGEPAEYRYRVEQVKPNKREEVTAFYEEYSLSAPKRHH